MKVFIKGLNTCNQRDHELEVYRRFLIGNGHEIVSEQKGSDAVLVWTCAFRGDVRDNSLDQLKSFCQEAEGDSRIIATGCLPDIAPESVGDWFKGELLPWKKADPRLEEFFRRPGGPSLASEDSKIFIEPALCEDAAAYRKANPEADVIFYDQFVKLLVAEGCPFTCTYCSERLAFPDFRSFPEDKLVAACKGFLETSTQRTVALIGDCPGEYGRDTGTDITQLAWKILNLHPDLKIVLTQFHPADFLKHFDKVVGLLESGRISHLNLPMQSASDRILKLMAREYNRSGLVKIMEALRRIGFTAFDTHIILGFPGETEEDFEATMDFLLTQKPRYVLMSRFMETSGMAASRLPDKVAEDIANRRLNDGERRLKAAGIICNSEAGNMMEERLKRLNNAQATA
ncbi:MAG: radical SAM protein [Alphaproteobacteria bacterium]|nr:radical SAM protein [Alphaproteobacteria bacterium]